MIPKPMTQKITAIFGIAVMAAILLGGLTFSQSAFAGQGGAELGNNIITVNDNGDGRFFVEVENVVDNLSFVDIGGSSSGFGCPTTLQSVSDLVSSFPVTVEFIDCADPPVNVVLSVESDGTVTCVSGTCLNSPPDITAPDDVFEECNEPGGAMGVDLGVPTVTDPDGNDLSPTNDAVEPFALGDTTVTWSVEDSDGASDSDTQTVTVEDTTAPEITVPDGFMVNANTVGGWSGDIGQATATDVCDSNVDITNDAPAVFPLGDTIVTWCARDDLGNASCATQIINVKPLPVDVDIKPESCPNSINTNSRGLLPVAILGNEVDVSQIDVSSIQIAGVSPILHSIEDVETPHTPDTSVFNPFDCSTEGPDGIDDLTLKFDMQEIVEALGLDNAPRGTVALLVLTGNLLDGTPLEGYDLALVR